MSNDKIKIKIFFLLAAGFYLLTLWFIFNDYSTLYFIPCGLIASVFVYQFRKLNKLKKENDS
jgi:hypothetical protein